MKRFLLFFASALLLITLSCNDDLIIGANLLDDENLNLDFTDTIQLSAKTVYGDSTLTFFNSQLFNKSTHLLGVIDEDQFGYSEAILYTNVSLGLSNFNFVEGSTIDSLVLVLPYDFNGMYGDTMSSRTVEVYELDNPLIDELELTDSIFSNQAFAANRFLGSNNVTPSSTGTFPISVPSQDTIVSDTVLQHIRVQLDPTIGEAILADSTLTQNDTVFQDFFKGLMVKTTGNDKGIMGINMLPGSGAVIGLYFTTPEDAKRVFSFEVGRIRHNNLIHDFTGSAVEQAVIQETNAELLYCQGMTGSNIVIDLSSIKDLPNDILINKAELELIIAQDELDLEVYPPLANFLATFKNEEENIVSIEDLTLLNQILGRNPSVEEIETLFGGNVVEEDGLMKYKMNLTNHILNILKEEITTTDLELIRYVKQQRADRVIIYSTNHPDLNLRPKLKLVVTKP